MFPPISKRGVVGWKNEAQLRFLTNFNVFGNKRKPSFECLIYLLKLLIILGEIRSKSSQNFMIIKITFLNLPHGSDLLCLLMSLRIIHHSHNKYCFLNRSLFFNYANLYFHLALFLRQALC